MNIEKTKLKLETRKSELSDEVNFLKEKEEKLNKSKGVSDYNSRNFSLKRIEKIKQKITELRKAIKEDG